MGQMGTKGSVSISRSEKYRLEVIGDTLRSASPDNDMPNWKFRRKRKPRREGGAMDGVVPLSRDVSNDRIGGRRHYDCDDYGGNYCIYPWVCHVRSPV